MTSRLPEFADLLSPLDDRAREALETTIRTVHFDKGDHVLASGRVCRYIYFIEAGLTKTCFDNGDKEFIMRFFAEHSIFTVLDSYFQHTPSTYDIIALEPATISYISKADMDELCDRHHSLERFFRSLVTAASINMMKRISEMLEEDAKQRYDRFLVEQGQLLKRISLADLASYLGITQVSLSRIRAIR
ncbi:Crp/Fnr family transcriptional regulator [Mucilaginibacter daejeonensis]|uniref:Crp/Fnr family transcriptional regulator n=1 Tax=Mucilaginibacter daejeonensis TaxID=398049 RepID=UPI001D17A0B5|nr:Crp/Fnr family transcriptional regulator [Mucilaginibacter daejeonensis]UEG51439.1 Crp/Fnr family transcriptional regulator [Mucilaginibacter daejeonensis]